MKASRRQFLERGVQGTMGATLVMSGRGDVRTTTATSDRVVIGIMGLGGQGTFTS
jgi:hypothetical protein